MKAPDPREEKPSARDKASYTGPSNVHNLLARLDKVKRTGPCTWQGCCPAHNDRGPSLSIAEKDDGRTEKDDGRILVHCFAGCGVHSVLAAVGMDISDLFPERAIPHRVGPERRPFPAADVLRAVGFEAMVVAAASVAMLAGQPLCWLGNPSPKWTASG